MESGTENRRSSVHVNEFRKDLWRQRQAIPARQKLVTMTPHASMQCVPRNFESDEEGSVQAVSDHLSNISPSRSSSESSGAMTSPKSRGGGSLCSKEFHGLAN